jgi:hypothetical protein
VLILSITATWAFGGATLLRRAAENLHETALNDLRRFHLLGQQSDAKRRAFDELMAEIRDPKTGAFAPLSDQPFVKSCAFFRGWPRPPRGRGAFARHFSK